MAYRFVHAADIHLDSPLRSLALRNPELAALIGNATRRAFVRIVDLCIDEQVDALLLAGDLYDGEQTSMKTARFLAEQVKRLHEAGVRTFVIRGNHDALSKITKELLFPESVKVFGGRADAVTIERVAGGFDVVLHGLSFAQPHAPESLLAKFKPPVDGAVNIALMHTSLAGSSGHDPYAPCAVADLHVSGFHYWALGHVHRRDVMHDTSPGSRKAATVVMPGMPQGRDINEAGPKSVTLVTVADDRTVTVEERVTSIAQFERVAVDLDGIDEWNEVVATIETALGRARDAAVSEHLVARLTLTGSTPLAWKLRRDGDLIRTEADTRAETIGRSWVEKLEVDCVAPEAGATPGAPGDPFAELRHLIGGEVLRSEAFRAEMAAIAEELRGQLPTECRATVLGNDAESFEAALARYVADGAEDVLARLHAPSADAPA